MHRLSILQAFITFLGKLIYLTAGSKIMDYYRLVPIYLNRWNVVLSTIKPGKALLNVGCGKGAFNHALSKRFSKTVGVDINPTDIEIARTLSKTGFFKVMDAGKLQFKQAEFDAVVCSEVLEHVKNPDLVLREISRVLKKGGQLVITVPNKQFPWIFDPINKLLNQFGRHLPIGAYACGHTWLPTESFIQTLLEKNGFSVRKTFRLSHHLMGLLELYHMGIWQSLVKENAKNSGNTKRRKSILHYDYASPSLEFIPRAIIWLDNLLFGWARSSVNLAFDAVKN